MIRVLTKKDFGLYYQCVLVVGLVFIFFTDLAIYMNHVGLAPPPKVWMVLFGLGSAPLLRQFVSRVKYIPKNVVGWCGLYLGVSLLSFIFVSQSEVANQELGIRIVSKFFLLLCIFIFSGSKVIENCARYTIVVCTIIAVLNNILELIDPSFFGGFNETGRPAGFYENPNKTACALLLGLLTGTSVLPLNYRLPFIALCCLGAFLTFSRGAILSLPIIIGIFTINHLISRKQLLYTVVGITIIVSVFGFSGDLLIKQAEYAGLNSNIIARLQVFFAPSAPSTGEDTSRLGIVPFSLQEFSEKPFLGHGIGYTQEWREIPPHNMYLLLMVEYGVLGTFIYPLLIFLVTHKARGETKCIGQAFLTFLLIWGIFSHNMLDERYVLLIFSLMASMNARSQLEHRSKIQTENKYSMNARILGGS